jgi:hypothetical protein
MHHIAAALAEGCSARVYAGGRGHAGLSETRMDAMRASMTLSEGARSCNCSRRGVAPAVTRDAAAPARTPANRLGLCQDGLA